MRRRDLIAGLLATATASTLRAAEPEKVYRIAHCSPLTIGAFRKLTADLYGKDLPRLGYVEGRNLVVDRYAADNKEELYPVIAREAVQSRPDVIIVGLSHELIMHVRKATSTIPIIALMGSVGAGLVQNIARPEGNITGVFFDAGIQMQGKHLDILRQAVPSVSRVAYLSPRAEWEGAWGRAILESARQLGISIIGMPMEWSADEQQYRQAFESIAQQAIDAVMFNGFGPNYRNRFLIAEIAKAHRLPSICWFVDVAKAEGFLAYASDTADLLDRFARQVDQALKGVKVADIPAYQPTKFILAVNLRTAKSLGLQIPASLVAQADEVIE
jgi:ABC-type uncharacterized transport system substrate-binding protein